MRTLARTEPKITQEGKALENGKFKGGSANGDVLVYDLDAQKAVGGYRWTAGSDPIVLDGKIAKDFEENIFAAIQQGFAKHVH